MTHISVSSWGGKPKEAVSGMEKTPGVHSSYTCLTLLVVVSCLITIGTSIGAAVTISKLLSGPCAPHEATTTSIAPNMKPTAPPPADVSDHGPVPADVYHHGPTGTAGQNVNEKQPFSFEDMYTLLPKSLQVQWIGDKEVMYLNDRLELILHHIDNDTKTVIMTNQTFIDYQAYYGFVMSPDRKFILIPYQFQRLLLDTFFFAKYKIYERETGLLHSFPNDDAMRDKVVMSVIWAPKESALSFVFEGDLYYQTDPTHTPERLTSSGSNKKIKNGVGFINYFVSRLTESTVAMWWSADLSQLAYGEFDSTTVKLVEQPIYQQQLYPDMYRQVFLKAGGAPDLPKYRIHVIDMTNSTRPRKTVPPPSEFRDRDHYFDGVLWKDDDTIGVLWTDRIKRRTIVELCDTKSPSLTCTRNHDMTVENGWYTGSHFQRFINDGSHYLAVLSKVVGDEGRYRQVAMVSSDDGTVTYLTDKDWEVNAVVGYDSEKKLVYYTGTTGLQLGMHVLRVGTPDADPSMRGIKCLTCDIEIEGCGYTAASFSPSAKNYLLTCLGPDIPSFHLKWTEDDTKDYNFNINDDIKAMLASRKLPTIEYHKLNIGDGYTGWAEFILPPDMVKDGSVKYPVMFYPYGGPVRFTQADYQYKPVNAHMGAWDYYLASTHNVVVVRLNTRGSSGRGDEYLYQLYRRLGIKDTTDQIDGAIYLKENFPYVNSSQLAMWGWSYGGFTTAHVMGHASKVFTCGISVAPLTSMRYYCPGYVERFMDLDTAADNAEGYNLTEVMRKVENFKNKKFMVAHGTLDDNTHFQNAIELINALSKEQIQFKTQIYPDQNHLIQDVPLNKHLFRAMTDFYIKDCLGRKD